MFSVSRKKGLLVCASAALLLAACGASREDLAIRTPADEGAAQAAVRVRVERDRVEPDVTAVRAHDEAVQVVEPEARGAAWQAAGRRVDVARRRTGRGEDLRGHRAARGDDVATTPRHVDVRGIVHSESTPRQVRVFVFRHWRPHNNRRAADRRDGY